MEFKNNDTFNYTKSLLSKLILKDMKQGKYAKLSKLIHKDMK